jgi:hypothetical protein
MTTYAIVPGCPWHVVSPPLKLEHLSIYHEFDIVSGEFPLEGETINNVPVFFDFRRLMVLNKNKNIVENFGHICPQDDVRVGYVQMLEERTVVENAIKYSDLIIEQALLKQEGISAVENAISKVWELIAPLPLTEDESIFLANKVAVLKNASQSMSTVYVRGLVTTLPNSLVGLDITTIKTTVLEQLDDIITRKTTLDDMLHG